MLKGMPRTDLVHYEAGTRYFTENLSNEIFLSFLEHEEIDVRWEIDNFMREQLNII